VILGRGWPTPLGENPMRNFLWPLSGKSTEVKRSVMRTEVLSVKPARMPVRTTHYPEAFWRGYVPATSGLTRVDFLTAYDAG